MSDHLFGMMPELRERDDGELRAETLASCEVNIAQMLRLQKLGAGPDALVLPVEAAGWALSRVAGSRWRRSCAPTGSVTRGCGTLGQRLGYELRRHHVALR